MGTKSLPSGWQVVGKHPRPQRSDLRFPFASLPNPLVETVKLANTPTPSSLLSFTLTSGGSA